MILKVIDAEPADFWAEVFQLGQFGGHRRATPPGAAVPSPFPSSDEVLGGLDRIRILYDGIVMVLTRKGLITSAGLEAAIAKAEEQKA